jgi:CheY-like chemotaxis protein
LAADHGTGHASTIVIADNDPTVVELLRTDLGLEGYRVLATVSNGDAAVQACAKLRPDLLIVDYRMPPGPNGLATIARVRAEGTVGEIVLYTNYRSSKLEQQAAELGAVLVAKGPLRSLREAVSSLLS